MSHADELYNNGLYLVGDSAYALRGFMMCPYDNATKGSVEDSFNFFQSSQRITIECCFGEVYRRWGVFWRPLQGNLDQHQYTIEACFRLHNPIVNYRESQKANGTATAEEIDDSELQHHFNSFSMENPFENLGIVTDSSRPPGRPRVDEKFERERGAALRDVLAHRINLTGISRPVG